MRAGKETELASRTDQRVLRWFWKENNGMWKEKNGRVPYLQNAVDGGSKWSVGRR